MMQIRRLIAGFGLVLAMYATAAAGQGNLEVDTPTIGVLKAAMQARYAQLQPLLDSGAVGLTSDGGVVLRDANVVPLAQRQASNALVQAENRDRAALYAEIARANGHPEWEAEVRRTFAQRWAEKARGGWYVQNAGGTWVRK